MLNVNQNEFFSTTGPLLIYFVQKQQLKLRDEVSRDSLLTTWIYRAFDYIHSRVTPDMALRLSKALGRSPESWLAMQDSHDLWLARQSTDLAKVTRLELAAA